MKHLVSLCLILFALPLRSETELEKTIQQRLPGAYGRMEGMVHFSVTLSGDGTYIFTQSDCFTTDRKNGKWAIVDDGVVVLDGAAAGFHRFRICVVKEPDGFALLPVDDRDSEKIQPESFRLFRRF